MVQKFGRSQTDHSSEPLIWDCAPRRGAAPPSGELPGESPLRSRRDEGKPKRSQRETPLKASEAAARTPQYSPAGGTTPACTMKPQLRDETRSATKETLSAPAAACCLQNFERILPAGRRDSKSMTPPTCFRPASRRNESLRPCAKMPFL